jgi:hypothetical protein
MTPWHRFWFPEHDTTRHAPRDAALWSPEALTALQQGLWHQASEATAQWWRFMTAAWPAVPVQPPSGSVAPAAAAEVPRRPARPQAARDAGARSRAPAPPSRRPRSTVARGK